MLTFFITTEERRRAQNRAAELDISKSDPPEQYPYLWDNRLNCVQRWYDYSSPADKLGAIVFETVTVDSDQAPLMVKCITHITYHVLGQSEVWRMSVDEPPEHQRLIEFFLRDLLATVTNHVEDIQTK